MDRFLGPGGWSTESRGAGILLRALEGRNEFFKAEEGSWQPLTEEELLQARQQALRWVLRSSRSGIRFTGLLAVDDEMRQGLLDGMKVEMISDNEFILSASDAKEFGARVKASGGSMEKGEPLPDPPSMPQKEQPQYQQQVDVWTRMDSEALRQVEGGDKSGVIDFQERGPQLRALVEKSRAEGGPEFERELLLRAGAEERMRVLLGEAVPGTGAALPALLQQLAMVWEENGQGAEWRDGEVIVRLPAGEVHIGSQVFFTSSEES